MLLMSVEPEELHEDARNRRQRMLDGWDALGKLLTSRGSRRQLKEHPLMRMLSERDLLCVRLAAPVRNGHPGPSPSAVPSFRKPRSSKFRAFSRRVCLAEWTGRFRLITRQRLRAGDRRGDSHAVQRCRLV
jgi:hypothetical protein